MKSEGKASDAAAKNEVVRLQSHERAPSYHLDPRQTSPSAVRPICVLYSAGVCGSECGEAAATLDRNGRRFEVKVLVPIKRVADPDNANKIKIAPSGNAVDTSGLEWKMNPFDEYALEAALRLTENGKTPKVRAGEVVVVTFGPKETEQTLRAALAT